MQNQFEKTLFILLLLVFNYSNAQDSLKSVKPNPIVFFEGYAGFGGGATSGVVYGATLNYQVLENDLFTFRLGGFSGFENKVFSMDPPVPVPVFNKAQHIMDYGLLYGKRWAKNGHSLSISAGISHVHWNHWRNEENNYYTVKDNSLGFPFELNFKWFKKEKRRLMAYGFIPLTSRQVSFGGSFGFKLVGNISKTNYFGIAISSGFGWHKKY
ncbi:hypothetical protein [Flavobacterium wongokense]|uniref:hypothetical protein n=1 Tax=Flavobacterium wongokense TaxID=2910674 RepID=UPI001F39B7E2|nr:hypothetical protein [Flavobacterium sp. WG47]MCF6131582.1 hypothetical protein [Flavobacterium sp. WG47]